MIQESFFGADAPVARSHEYPIPPVASIVSCRSCGAAIVWTHTPTGRAVPLALSTAQTRDGQQYAVSHFRDCPDAKAWGR